MAYAGVPDVKARAGRLRTAFGNSGAPDDTEIGVFLDTVAGDLDSRLGALGIATPVSDTAAVRALQGVNADGAFLLAAPAAFPTEQAIANAKAAIDAAQARYSRALAAIDAGTFSAVVLLLAEAGTGSAASDFWTENPDWNSPASVAGRAANPYTPDVPLVERNMGF